MAPEKALAIRVINEMMTRWWEVLKKLILYHVRINQKTMVIVFVNTTSIIIIDSVLNVDLFYKIWYSANMKAKFISMHRIVDRQTLKILPLKDHSVEFIVQRMYESWASVRGAKIEDIQLGTLADIIDTRKSSGTWHHMEQVEYLKTTYATDGFDDDSILCPIKVKVDG